jgi:anti-sigma-K factor RskA
MSTPVEQIVALMAEMTFAEKLALNERLAISLRKEGGAAAPGKKRGGSVIC